MRRQSASVLGRILVVLGALVLVGDIAAATFLPGLINAVFLNLFPQPGPLLSLADFFRDGIFLRLLLLALGMLLVGGVLTAVAGCQR